MSAPSYARSKLEDTLTVFEGSVGCTWCVRVSLEVLNDLSTAIFLCSGMRVQSLDIAKSVSVVSMPKVSEILLNYRSHKSDFWKLLLTVMTPFGPGIFNRRYA